MKIIPYPVVYLDGNDFDENGYIINKPIVKINNTKPVFIMIQANFCFHCTESKPEYYKFAINNIDKVFCTTIQGDSDIPEVKALMKRIHTIYPEFQGYPSYVVYYKDKRILYKGGRRLVDLQMFLNKLLTDKSL